MSSVVVRMAYVEIQKVLANRSDGKTSREQQDKQNRFLKIYIRIYRSTAQGCN